MKKLFLLIVLVGISYGCKGQVPQNEPKATDTILGCADYSKKITDLEACVAILQDSIAVLNSTIPMEAYMNARRIEKIKYYIKITDQTPTNKKYFFGWIKRTMSED